MEGLEGLRRGKKKRKVKKLVIGSKQMAKRVPELLEGGKKGGKSAVDPPQN